MIPIEMRLKAERRARQILSEERVAQPDVVYYGDSCVVFYWHGRDDAVIFDVSHDGQIGESRLGEPPIGADIQTAEGETSEEDEPDGFPLF